MPPETTITLHTSNNVRIEHITSNGCPSPDGWWYDQDEDEWVFIHQGTATLEFDDGRLVEMKAGDFLRIPAHSKHRVQSVSEDAVWIAVFTEKLVGPS